MTQPPAGRRDSLRVVVTALVLAALGGCLAAYGALLSPTGPRIGLSQPLPLGLLPALVGVPVAVLLGLRAGRSRWLAAVPVVVWTVLVVLLGTRSRYGSVVLAGGSFQVSTTVVSLAGLLAGLATLFAVRPGR